MMYSQLLQVILASCLLTMASMLMLRSARKRMVLWFEQQLSPRHLKFHGIRHRTPTAPVVNKTDEPS
jgi:hypothetical protein